MYETSKQRYDRQNDTRIIREATRRKMQKGARSRSRISTRGRRRDWEQGTGETCETKKENWV